MSEEDSHGGQSGGASYDPKRLARDSERVARDFWSKLRRNLDRVPFLDELLAAYYCAVDPKTPLQVKAVLLGALAYFIMPADLVPDFIALVGFGDDAAVIAAAIQTVRPHIKPEHRRRARDWLAAEGHSPEAET